VEDDRFIIIACDGLWDVLTNEQAVEIVLKYNEATKASAALRDHAHCLGSTDNISVIVYFFNTEIHQPRRVGSKGVNNERISKSQSRKTRVKTMEIDPSVIPLDYSSHI